MDQICADTACDIVAQHPTHTPETRLKPWYNRPVRFFKRMPGGGTVYKKT